MDFKMNIFHSNPPHKNDIKPQAQSISILFTNSSAPSIKKLILQYYNNSKERYIVRPSQNMHRASPTWRLWAVPAWRGTPVDGRQGAGRKAARNRKSSVTGK
jgi:hypothetical protein